MGEGIGGRAGVAGHCVGGTAIGAAHGLSLAAAPAFAIMALATAQNDGAADILCSGAHDASSPLGGMTLMYALMSVVHMAPWLKLISSGRKPVR